MNDVAMMAVAQRPSEEFLSRGKRQFDRLNSESSKIARTTSHKALHPYLIGVAHRIGHLTNYSAISPATTGAPSWTGDRILDWFREQRPFVAALSER